MAVRAHTGRRVGDSGTREAILTAARRQFAELGYDRTSMRQVALEAGVDPTLVSHFHGSKQKLFLAVIELPFSPADVLPELLAGDPQEIGVRFANRSAEQFYDAENFIARFNREGKSAMQVLRSWNRKL